MSYYDDNEGNIFDGIYDSLCSPSELSPVSTPFLDNILDGFDEDTVNLDLQFSSTLEDEFDLLDDDPLGLDEFMAPDIDEPDLGDLDEDDLLIPSPGPIDETVTSPDSSPTPPSSKPTTPKHLFSLLYEDQVNIIKLFRDTELRDKLINTGHNKSYDILNYYITKHPWNQGLWAVLWRFEEFREFNKKKDLMNSIQVMNMFWMVFKPPPPPPSGYSKKISPPPMYDVNLHSRERISNTPDNIPAIPRTNIQRRLTSGNQPILGKPPAKPLIAGNFYSSNSLPPKKPSVPQYFSPAPNPPPIHMKKSNMVQQNYGTNASLQGIQKPPARAYRSSRSIQSPSFERDSDLAIGGVGYSRGSHASRSRGRASPIARGFRGGRSRSRSRGRGRGTNSEMKAVFRKPSRSINNISKKKKKKISGRAKPKQLSTDYSLDDIMEAHSIPQSGGGGYTQMSRSKFNNFKKEKNFKRNVYRKNLGKEFDDRSRESEENLKKMTFASEQQRDEKRGKKKSAEFFDRLEAREKKKYSKKKVPGGVSGGWTSPGKTFGSDWVAKGSKMQTGDFAGSRGKDWTAKGTKKVTKAFSGTVGSEWDAKGIQETNKEFSGTVGDDWSAKGTEKATKEFSGTVGDDWSAKGTEKATKEFSGTVGEEWSAKGTEKATKEFSGTNEDDWSAKGTKKATQDFSEVIGEEWVEDNKTQKAFEGIHGSDWDDKDEIVEEEQYEEYTEEDDEDFGDTGENSEVDGNPSKVESIKSEGKLEEKIEPKKSKKSKDDKKKKKKLKLPKFVAFKNGKRYDINSEKKHSKIDLSLWKFGFSHFVLEIRKKILNSLFMYQQNQEKVVEQLKSKLKKEKSEKNQEKIIEKIKVLEKRINNSSKIMDKCKSEQTKKDTKN